ncbi:MAG: hypothetical protein CL933_26185 [Deltaproteobacteria bacterium]|nr:hypothetical protein [Deltaproteobacteria bacterium]
MRAPSAGRGLFEEIRIAAAEVTRRARFVRIDGAGLDAFAGRLAQENRRTDDLDPGTRFTGDAGTMLAFTLLLDAINFGSGWFPVLAKRAGMSGYQTVATACRERFEAVGGPSGADLRGVTAEWMAELLGQDISHAEVAELMELFAQAWRDFGEWLGAAHQDRFESVVEAAESSAERLVLSLSEMPLYRDVSRYEELEVPLFKRAQITAADLNRAFGRGPFGRFDDLDRLTLFADNLVPHLLRCRGVLVYQDALAERIRCGERLAAGSLEEVEIRAVAVEAVERLVAVLASLGHSTTAHAVDGLLWNAGQAPEIKATPRHRTRCSFY